MFGIGDTELLLILLFAFLLLGPDKLPAIGRTIGKGLRQFKQAQDSVTQVVQTTVLDPMKDAASDLEKGVAATPEAPAPTRGGETFAERKARLAREAEEAKAASEEAPEPVVASAAEPRREAEVITLNPQSPSPTAEARPRTSVAALYGLGTEDAIEKEDGVVEA